MTVMNSRVFNFLSLGAAALLSIAVAAPSFLTADVPPPVIVPEAGMQVSGRDQGVLIWDNSGVENLDNPNVEFPHLVRFGDYWYCSFREGLRHGNHISGQGRVIRSADGVNWETVALFESATGDVRDPRLSVTADGQLMVNASIYFISDVAPLAVVDGVTVQRQSVTWLSPNGVDWSGPYACSSGINTWRWDVAWHDDFGYSVGYSGKDAAGTLYRTADGKNWEVVLGNFFPGRGYNEAALTFGADGVAYCLLRGGSGSQDATLGVGLPPYDQEWSWRKLDVMRPDADIRRPFASTGARNLGGPTIITLDDGRLLGAARMAGVKVFIVDPDEATMTLLIDVQGGSYPGLAEYEDDIWYSYTHSSKGPVALARARIPGRLTMDQLNEVADRLLADKPVGFGMRYYQALAALRHSTAHDEAGRHQRALHSAIADYQAAAVARVAAEGDLKRAVGRQSPVVSGYGYRQQERIAPAVDVLKAGLADVNAGTATIAAGSLLLSETIRGFDAASNLRASAEVALAAAAGVTGQPAEGFAQVFRNSIQRRSEELQRLLRSADSPTAEVRLGLDDLRGVLGQYRQVDRFPAAPIIEVSGLPAQVEIGEGVSPGGGLLVNTRAEGNWLMLDDMPVLAFSGSGVGVNLGNPPSVASITDEITISVWAYPESSESYRTILAKGHAYNGHNGFYLRHGRTIQNSNHVVMGIFGLDEPHDPYTHSYTPGDPQGFDHQWHHYAYTFDGTEFNLYVDGERVAGEAFETVGSKGIDLSGGELTVGSFLNVNGGVMQPWHGYIKDIRIRNQALSADQIRAEMNRTPLADEPELVGFWPLNEGEGERVLDHSGKDNHGTIHRAQWESIVVRSGYRLSGPFRFIDAKPDSSYTVQWQEGNMDENSSIAIQVGFSNSPDTLPERWQAVGNGGAVEGEAGCGPFLWVWQEMTSGGPEVRTELRGLVLGVGE